MAGFVILLSSKTLISNALILFGLADHLPKLDKFFCGSIWDVQALKLSSHYLIAELLLCYQNLTFQQD